MSTEKVLFFLISISLLLKAHSFGTIPSILIPALRITEHTEYQFPKEQTLCYSENRIAEMTKIKAMRPRKSGYTIFPPKDGRKLPKEHNCRLFCLFRTNRYSAYSADSAIGSRIDGILFRSFWSQNRSQKNTITANSVYSYSGMECFLSLIVNQQLNVYAFYTSGTCAVEDSKRFQSFSSFSCGRVNDQKTIVWTLSLRFQ